MALYAFDGTGNQDEDDAARDTNVIDFFTAYIDPNKNTDPDLPSGSLYLKGIGRQAETFVGREVSEAFGIGGFNRVDQALRRLMNNRAQGDNVVDIVGFSRGAALAMSFSNRIAAAVPDQLIRFVGVFDVVGQFGAPGRFVNAGHILTLPQNVQCCRHAMALDESRAFFPLTRLCDSKGNPAETLVELWFRGVHSDIGGGNGNRGLNWIALNWMFMNARRAGVPLDQGETDRNLQDQNLPREISDHRLDLDVKRTFFATDCLHSSVELTPGTRGRLHNNPPMVLRRMGDDGEFVNG